MHIHKGTIRLKTERLILREFTLADATDMFNNWASDDEVTKYLSWPTHKDIETSKNVASMWVNDYIKPEYYLWAIEVKDSGQVVGSIAVMSIDNNTEMCEIGYCIGKAFWNKGIVTEALKGVVKYAFNEVGFNRIMCRHHIGNNASGRVMEKASLQYEGLLRQVMKNNKGKLVDCKYYSMLKEEYNVVSTQIK